MQLSRFVIFVATSLSFMSTAVVQAGEEKNDWTATKTKVATAKTTTTTTTTESAIHWTTWTDDLFDRAKKENKLVLLDLEAVWCHWCHVMDEKTYSDPKVAQIINDKYIAVKVDQDSRPDLSTRYEDYGWPATVVFSPKGEELLKKAGYAPANVFLPALEKLAQNPVPMLDDDDQMDMTKLQASNTSALTPDLQKEMHDKFMKFYDHHTGGWQGPDRYLDADSVELAMREARLGSKDAEKMVKQTLQANLRIFDPVWGGVYQYSAGQNWNEPHFEKIMSMQAANMRIYADAYRQFKDPRYLKAAKDVERYLTAFLKSPDGAFYTSQDADLVDGVHSANYFRMSDKARRAKGIPRIDQHIYARENGWAITALCALYQASQDEQFKTEAITAANWILKNRQIKHSGFRHDAEDKAGPYLGDNLAMAQAMLSLYTITGDRTWLKNAERTTDFINDNFRNTDSHEKQLGGFVTAANVEARHFRANLNKEENIETARFTNLLAHYTGNDDYRKMADRAMKFLTVKEIALDHSPSGILLASDEISKAPVHLTIVGAKNDPDAKALFLTALSYPGTYNRVEWWDRSEGPLLNADVKYPELPKAAAFACSDKRCSIPVFEATELSKKIDKLLVFDTTNRPAEQSAQRNKEHKN